MLSAGNRAQNRSGTMSVSRMTERKRTHIPDDVLSACCILFNARMGIARGIVNALHSLDVAVAFNITVDRHIPDSKSEGAKMDRAGVASLKKLTHARAVLSTYIAGNGSADVNASYTDALEVTNDTVKLPDTKTYFQGQTGGGRLRFGSFLFYKGTVPLESVRRALEWQRSRRPLIGRLAMEKNFLLPSDFAEILFYLPAGDCFGEVAVRRGCLSERQLASLLNEQRRYSSPVGEYFILEGHLSRTRLERYHREFIRHNRRHAFDEKCDAVARM